MKLSKTYAKINVKVIPDSFLRCNQSLKSLDMPLVETIGNSFLCCNNSLESLSLPLVKTIGNYFLSCNKRFKDFKKKVLV